MRTKIIVAAGAVLFAAAVLATAYEHRSRSAEDALFKANVEALVQNETSEGVTFYCRCHSKENACYGGNAISFRKLCARLNNTSTANCSIYNYEEECI